MAFFTPCLRSSDSSVLKHPSLSIKTFLRRQMFKKSSGFPKSQSSIQKQESTRKFKRIKRSNIIQEVLPTNQTTDLISNYDMTVYHDDELDDTQVALSHRQSKKIPRWSRKSQLQLAIINQIYYNDKKPEDIFGSIHLDLAYQMVDSIELWNTELSCFHSYSKLPPNFV